MQIFHLYDEDGGERAVEEGLLNALEKVRMGGGKRFATVIDGKALNFALKHYRKEFLELGVKCYSVLITRATPIQKAKAVELVMQETKSVCLAVGDGANDVSDLFFFFFFIFFYFFFIFFFLFFLSYYE